MKNDAHIKELLHNHGLKKTNIRSEMLELFMKCNFALSASDIMAKMKTDYDRVTIYRALSAFEENGILHRASEDSQGVKYALCGNRCPDESHLDKHAHFVCDICHQTYCLDHVEVPPVKVSDDFKVSRVSYTLGGVCKECRDSEEK